MLRYDYPMMIPPFEVKDYSTMTPKEAKQHFDWFVGEVPKRIRLLLGAIEYSEAVITEFKGGLLHPPTVILNRCSFYIKRNSDKTMLSLFQVWENFV